MLQGLLTAFGVRIPLSYLFRSLPSTNMLMIGIAVPVSAVVSLLLCIIYFFIVRKKLPKTPDVDLSAPEPSEPEPVSEN